MTCARALCANLALSVLVGCSSTSASSSPADDDEPVEITPILGGGLAGVSLASELKVAVIDATSGSAVRDASIALGLAEPKLAADGRARFTVELSAEPLAVSVSAPGYV